MQLSNLKFTFEDFVKLAGFMVTFMVGYYNLVSEIKENKIINASDRAIVNFRIDRIEKQLNIAGVAILPIAPTVPKQDEE